jgi:hypothetical protein
MESSKQDNAEKSLEELLGSKNFQERINALQRIKEDFSSQNKEIFYSNLSSLLNEKHYKVAH